MPKKREFGNPNQVLNVIFKHYLIAIDSELKQHQKQIINLTLYQHKKCYIHCANKIQFDYVYALLNEANKNDQYTWCFYEINLEDALTMF